MDQQGQETNSPEPIECSPAQGDFHLVCQLTRGLEDCDWEQLQEKYADAMEEHGRVEETVRAETAKLLEVFMAWSQTTVLQDENRAFKRLGGLTYNAFRREVETFGG
ncbi:hypothetical protein NUU61_007087 [Penicillium alfredii]|uniref:Uncharacterized protein n=1 Tax=Penicillium alfredii TaxID=1506179 RepID=A0A9W9F260_9EURO|nr:uncharacterized protein NUU61_007087 [Penicillium alfredii]KAJ5092217.1 hypothetical protein NUU61_007087 [Penicillium alfredii]